MDDPKHEVRCGNATPQERRYFMMAGAFPPVEAEGRVVVHGRTGGRVNRKWKMSEE